ncbi:MAG: TPM domain-containing protein [Acutalibacteraceae bacterium]|nr:TPM domain-containing protein [Acutalibacteraceae bacterium]
MKKIIITALTVALIYLANITCFAEGDISRLNDMADIFTDDEEALLLEKQDKLSEKYSVDIVVLTTSNLDGKKLADYAEEYFDKHGFGYGERGDGMMITMCTETNTFYTSAAGQCAQLLDEDSYAYLDNAVLDVLHKDDTTYADGMEAYLNACDELLSKMDTTTVEELPLLIDNADFLPESEEKKLADKLDEMSKRLKCDVIVLTEATIDKKAEIYADDYFDYNGYGQGGKRDGILLLVSVKPRNWHISGSGICNSEYISTAELEYIAEEVVDDLKAEDYVSCFNTYADRCNEVITSAREGKVFKEPFNKGMSLIISLAIGFIVAFIATSIMKSKLKSVKFQSAAANYVKTGSLMITDSREMFLYNEVTYTERADDNNSSSDSHTSSSGRSHSGVGGSY